MMKIEEGNDSEVMRRDPEPSPSGSILETSEGIEEKISMKERQLVRKQPLVLNMETIRHKFHANKLNLKKSNQVFVT